MDDLLTLAQRLAKFRRTTVIAHRLSDNDTIIFVLESGSKFKMTREELVIALNIFERSITTAKAEATEAREEKRKSKKGEE